MTSVLKTADSIRLRITLVLPFCLAAIFVCHPQESLARRYSPPQPDPWYSMSVEFDPSSLPPGVKILEKEYRLSFYRGIGRYRYFYNESATPFYLVRTLSSPIDWIGHVPPNEIPIKKIVNGQAFELDLTKDVWKVHIQDRSFIPLKELLIDNYEAVFGEKGRGRPYSAVAPPPKTLRFRMIYGGKELVLKGRATYERNPEYNPKRKNKYYSSNWFQIRSIQFDYDEFPPGIIIAEDEGIRHPLLKLKISNESATPLYVTARSQEPVSWVSQFPPGKIPYGKFVDGKSWGFSSPRKSYQLGETRWVGGFKPDRTEGRIEQRYILRESAVESQQIRADDRPEQVRIPPAQDFAIEAYYGTSPAWIRGKIIYALNEKYRPDAGRGPLIMTSCAGFTCPGWEKQIVFFQVTILNALLMNLLFFRMFKSRTNRLRATVINMIIGLAESFLILAGFYFAQDLVFYNSLNWIGLKGYNLVALMVMVLYLLMSLPLLFRYRFSMKECSVVLVGSFLLIRGTIWISGYS